YTPTQPAVAPVSSSSASRASSQRAGPSGGPCAQPDSGTKVAMLTSNGFGGQGSGNRKNFLSLSQISDPCCSGAPTFCWTGGTLSAYYQPGSWVARKVGGRVVSPTNPWGITPAPLCQSTRSGQPVPGRNECPYSAGPVVSLKGAELAGAGFPA